MRDYALKYSDGSSIPVARLPSQEIMEILDEGFVVLDSIKPEAIRERLLLELFIRANGLRPAEEN